MKGDGAFGHSAENGLEQPELAPRHYTDDFKAVALVKNGLGQFVREENRAIMFRGHLGRKKPQLPQEGLDCGGRNIPWMAVDQDGHASGKVITDPGQAC